MSTALANHLTPDELAQEVGIDADEIIRICDEKGIPFRNIGGRIDKSLFKLHLKSQDAAPQVAAVN